MRSYHVALLVLPFTLVVLTSSASAQALDDVHLPEPSGPHEVGTVVWHWEGRQQDSTSRMLEIIAQLWYPGIGGAETKARYRPLGGDQFDRVKQNSVGAAPFAEIAEKVPVVVVCPGRGTNRYYYTSVAEDLASRGFAVLAVDIPHIGYTEFPDGRIIEPSEEYRPSFELITGPYEKVDAFFAPAVSIGLEHLHLALDRLATLNDHDPAGRFTGRLRMESMGTFGHSLGGRICGAWAANEERVVAFASMEGVPPRKVRQTGMTAASLLIYSSELPEDIALPNIRELYDNRIAEATILRLEGFGHNSVTDRPLIFPESFNYSVSATKGLEVFRHVLSEFFDAHLMGGSFSPAKIANAPEVTLVETSIDESRSMQPTSRRVDRTRRVIDE